MGRDKATLPFGSEPMLARVARRIGDAVPQDRIIVVAAPQQSLPALPNDLRVVRDSEEFRGPLAGIATGLRAIAGRVDAVYVTACDVPLLVPAFVNRMFDLLADFDVVVPFDGQHHHSLAAVYRPTVLPHIEQLLAADRLRPPFLFEKVRTREADVEQLRAIDPRLATLENVNDEASYRATLAAAGFRALPEPE